MAPSDLHHLTDDQIRQLAKGIESQIALWSRGGPFIHNIAFVIGLFGVMAGVGGILHGAFGDASPSEFQLTSISLIIGIPAALYAHKNDKTHRELRKEYFAILGEIEKRKNS